MPTVLTRKNVLIIGLLNASNTFTASINNVQFAPDELIIHSVAWYDGGSGSGNFILSSNLVDNQQMFSIPTTYDTYNSQNAANGVLAPTPYNALWPLNITFDIKKNIQGTYNFTCVDTANGVASVLTGTLVMQCEFVKYNNKNPY